MGVGVEIRGRILKIRRACFGPQKSILSFSSISFFTYSLVLKERGGWIVKEGGPQNRLRYVSNL